MTINRDIVAELRRSIADRAQIWNQYDEAQQEGNKLTQYRQFERGNVSETLTALTAQNTPPDEIAATLWQLKNESEAIAAANSQIQDCQASIQKAKNQSFIVIGGAVALVFTIVLVLTLR